MRKLSLAISVASMCVGFSAWAISPTIQVSELPKLEQEPQHKVASKRVTDTFIRSHYHRFNLDDAYSVLIYQRFLNQLDYQRNVLLQSDIDSFNKYSKQFDDMYRSLNALKSRFIMYLANFIEWFYIKFHIKITQQTRRFIASNNTLHYWAL